MNDEKKPDMANQDTASANPGGRASKSRRALIFMGVAIALVLGGTAYGIWWSLDGRWYEETDDAYVQGNAVPLMPQVEGTVVSIATDTTQLVRQGQPVVQLDTTDADLTLRQDEANLAQAVRQARQLFDTATQMQHLVDERRDALEQARLDYVRNQQLLPRQGVSVEQMQQSRTSVATDEAQLKQAESQLHAATAAIDHTDPTTQPAVLQAEAALRAAWVARQRTTITAPVTGYVAQRSVQVGQRVQNGTQLLTIVPVEQMWVEANFKETQLAHVRIGQPVVMHADLYGNDVTFAGKVVGIGLGTGNAFSLLPAENATGNWIKIVQRVPVRLQPDLPTLQAHPLRIGLSMDASISLRDSSGPVLATTPPAQVAYHTNVYANDEQGVDKVIARVVAENMGTAAGDERRTRRGAANNATSF